MNLVNTIEQLTRDRLGRVPDWKNPTGYNDKIQWLKVHDQTPKHVQACDKLAARDLVKEAAGDVLLPLYYSGDKVQHIEEPHALKANHDCGSVRFVTTPAEFDAAKRHVQSALTKQYGVHKGEWAYALIEPKVMAEALMPSPVVDYKFHCAHGNVRWVQVISGRSAGRPKETILGPDGELMALHMDHKMQHWPYQDMYPGDAAWSELDRIARSVSVGWRYIRVDLYWVKSGPLSGARFGELTFWPLAGSYKTAHEPIFGRMMDIDLSVKHEPIVS